MRIGRDRTIPSDFVGCDHACSEFVGDSVSMWMSGLSAGEQGSLSMSDSDADSISDSTSEMCPC